MPTFRVVRSYTENHEFKVEANTAEEAALLVSNLCLSQFVNHEIGPDESDNYITKQVLHLDAWGRVKDDKIETCKLWDNYVLEMAKSGFTVMPDGFLVATDNPKDAPVSAVAKDPFAALLRDDYPNKKLLALINGGQVRFLLDNLGRVPTVSKGR
jgi:hypothetical protein